MDIQRTLWALSLILLTACDGERAEYRRGVELASYRCGEIPDQGIFVDGRYPVTMFCDDDVCGADYGQVTSSKDWYQSAECPSSGGSITAAMVPFDPDEYDHETEFMDREDGFPLLMHCNDQNQDWFCWLGFTVTDFLGDVVPPGLGNHWEYYLLDWTDLGTVSIVGCMEAREGTPALGQVPLPLICDEASTLVNCTQDIFWRMEGEVFTTCEDANPSSEVVTLWLGEL